ncbi:MAG: hypothetical protein K9M07_05415 [Simkaniaceae bacterium]|nr:hypothetical protein [Simkaniaceae bacterium]MCF7852658.1 hypothetical protein [Simkaniaceae bacterium]
MHLSLDFRIPNHELDRTFCGSAINGIRRYVTSAEQSATDPVTTSARRFFTGMLTIAVGIVGTPVEFTLRSGYGFVQTLLFCEARQGKYDIADHYAANLKTEAKTLLTVAKLWVFFSNPFILAAYMIVNMAPDAYRLPPKETEQASFFDSTLNTDGLEQRNELTQYLHKTIVKDAKTYVLAKRVFMGVSLYAIASAYSVMNLGARLLTLSTSALAHQVTQFAFIHLEKRFLTYRNEQAMILSKEILHLGYLWNPVGCIPLIMQYAFDDFFTSHEVTKIELDTDMKTPAIATPSKDDPTANPFTEATGIGASSRNPIAAPQVEHSEPTADATQNRSRPAEFNPFEYSGFGFDDPLADELNH